jgi:hypothetical protein
VPENLFPMMPGLEGIYTLTPTITAPFTKSTIQNVFDCLNIIQSKMSTRNELLKLFGKPLLDDELGNQYIPGQVQCFIEPNLSNFPSEEFINLMHAADFLGAFCLTNACVMKWLKQWAGRVCWHEKIKLYDYIQYDDLKKIAEKEEILETIIDTYINKNWNSGSCEKIPYTISIADLYALNLLNIAQITTYRHFFVTKKKLTSLEGLNQIPNISTIFNLDLEGNKLTTLDVKDLRCLSELIILNVMHNPITSINLKIFKYLPALKHLFLGHTQLSTSDKETIKKALPHVEVHF